MELSNVLDECPAIFWWAVKTHKSNSILVCFPCSSLLGRLEFYFQIPKATKVFSVVNLWDEVFFYTLGKTIASNLIPNCQHEMKHWLTYLQLRRNDCPGVIAPSFPRYILFMDLFWLFIYVLTFSLERVRVKEHWCPRNDKRCKEKEYPKVMSKLK